MPGPRSPSIRHPLVVAAAGFGLAGCSGAPSTVAAADDVPSWSAPAAAALVVLALLVVAGVVLLQRRRRGRAPGPGTRAQPHQGQAGPASAPPAPLVPPPPGAPTLPSATGAPPPPVTPDGPSPSLFPVAPQGPVPAAAADPHAPPPPSAGPIAGWYPDPGGSGAARYWDGRSWTRHTR